MTEDNVLDSLFVAEASGDGNGFKNWTLLAHTSRFIAMAEAAFGPRDASFTFVGTQICRTPDKFPHTWFPDSGKDANGNHRHVGIVLGHLALDNFNIAVWQLAHECVHLIDPRLDLEGRRTNYLEEGLATWFQDVHSPHPNPQYSRHPHYAIAKALVQKFMNDRLLPKAIREIRAMGIRIGDISPEVLILHCPETKGVAKFLCTEFETLPFLEAN